MTRNPARLLVLPAVGLLALTTACGGKDSSSAGSSSTSSTTSTTASATPTATDAASASATATDVASGSATATASASGKTYTDAQLSAMLDGVKVNGSSLTPLPASVVSQAKNAQSSQLGKILQGATITPAACKKMVVSGMAAMASGTPLAMSSVGSGSPIVVLRSMASADAAKGLIDQTTSALPACSSYTIVMHVSGKTISAKGTAKGVALTSASAEDETGQLTSSTASTGSTKGSSAIGRVGNVLVQLTWSGRQATAAEMSAALEAVSASVAKSA